jgi:glutamine amidotransferase
VTGDPARLDRTERIIFPGVGAAGEAMANLRASGLDGWIRRWVGDDRPVLGICLGTQVIFDKSEEDGGTSCLGILPGVVRRFPAGLEEGGEKLKIPHMGWNTVHFLRDHPVFAGIPPEAEFYFVHSFYPDPRTGNESSGRPATESPSAPPWHIGTSWPSSSIPRRAAGRGFGFWKISAAGGKRC